MHKLKQRYLAFAENEAKGVSPLYESLARGVAESELVCAFLERLPPHKQQPNLLLGAVRLLGASPGTIGQLERVVQRREEELLACIRSHSTQTNEPGRCATLLPALAGLPEPLALLEVGASAGLCLLPDRYGYDYDGHELHPDAPSGAYPIFRCKSTDNTPLPERLPRVVWRAGIDLNPLSAAEDEAMDWLRALVWPEHDRRAANLELAIGVARVDLPKVHKGDLLELQRHVAASAPEDATLVIYHTSVLCYLTPDDRSRFVSMVGDVPGVWVANEAPGVLPDAAARLDRDPPSRRFVLSIDGYPVAFTGPHGQSIDWFA